MVKVAELTDQELIDGAKDLINQSIGYLKANGIEMPLDKWVTIKKYCEMFNIESTSVVSNWIARGVIPKENVQTISELNDIKLIKAIAYK